MSLNVRPDPYHHQGIRLHANEKGYGTASVQISGITLSWRTARRIALWLLQFADWAEDIETRRRLEDRVRMHQGPIITSVRRGDETT